MSSRDNNAPAPLERPGARINAQEAMTMQHGIDSNGRDARRRPGVPATGVRDRRDVTTHESEDGIAVTETDRYGDEARIAFAVYGFGGTIHLTAGRGRSSIDFRSPESLDAIAIAAADAASRMRSKQSHKAEVPA